MEKGSESGCCLSQAVSVAGCRLPKGVTLHSGFVGAVVPWCERLKGARGGGIFPIERMLIVLVCL